MSRTQKRSGGNEEKHEDLSLIAWLWVEIQDLYLPQCYQESYSLNITVLFHS